MKIFVENGSRFEQSLQGHIKAENHENIFFNPFLVPSARSEIDLETDKRGSNHALSSIGNPKTTAVFIGSPSLPSKVPQG